MDNLSHTLLDAFFVALAAHLPCRVRLIVTGGAEALLLGSTRPTRDLDFEIAVAAQVRAVDRHWAAVEAAIAAASQSTGVAVQYSSDIDRWSSIAMPDYRHHTRPYRRFGRLSVHLLEPAHWAVPKLARYLDTDVTDLQMVLPAQSIRPQQLARVCGLALRASPRSTALFTFRQHVEHFLREHGPDLWVNAYDSEAAVRVFRRAAGIEV